MTRTFKGLHLQSFKCKLCQAFWGQTVYSFMVYNHQHVYRELITLSWFATTSALFCKFFWCHNSSSDLSFWLRTVICLTKSRHWGIFLIQLIIILTRKDFPRWKWFNHATLFLWEWALSRDKNNHRAWALVHRTTFLGFLLPHYLHADLFMFSHTLISVCIKHFLCTADLQGTWDISNMLIFSPKCS